MPSEFNLIEKLTKSFPKFHPIHTDIGDDAAVLQLSENEFEVLTLDTLAENDHYNLNWSGPQQIGIKAVEVNVSDIAAMGATPTYALISIVLTKETDEKWITGVYEGIKESCEKHKVSLIGGDTTHGQISSISITMLGKTDKQKLCLRSHAKPGDLICVTGQVGGSTAGYKSYCKNIEPLPYPKQRHLEPKARLEASKIIAPLANAMIDVSDGVGSETKHIAKMSQVGAVIHEDLLPIHKEVFETEENLELEKYSCALSGGEDFELLFTLPEKNLKKLKKDFDDFTIIGEILEKKEGLHLSDKNDNLKPIPDGYDHLKQ